MKIEKTFQESYNWPDVEEQAYQSKTISKLFLYDANSREQGNLYKEFADASNRFSNAIGQQQLKSEKPDPISYFQKSSGLTNQQQDSLWFLYQRYIKSVDKLVALVLPARRYYRQCYEKVIAIQQEANRAPKEQKKTLQAALDSATILPGNRIYRIEIDDQRRLNDFISYIKFRSNPAEELILNNLLGKLNEVFVSKGKLMLYKKIFSIESISSAERNQLFVYLTVLKNKTDHQLTILVR